MAVLEFPRLLLREKSHSWNPRGIVATAGQTADNVSTIIRSDGGGFWVCTMSDVSLGGRGAGAGHARQKTATLLWRAVRQLCDGGVNPIVVPRNDALFRPWPTGLAQGELSLPHGDGALFDDGSGYYQPVIDVTCAAASLRAVFLNLTLLQCGPLQGGESFSILHDTAGWRLYEISTVVYSDPTHATVTFRPPLREDVTAGTVVEFDRPRCTMRLATPNAMDLAVVPWTFNTASVSFVEAALS